MTFGQRVMASIGLVVIALSIVLAILKELV